MSARPRRPIEQSFSYHRLRDVTVAERIVASTGLAPPATVIEFGAGGGMLTAAIAHRSGRVIAIERDRRLYHELKQRFRDQAHVQPVLADCLAYALPARGRYFLVANPPFSETAPILRKIVSSPHPPAAAFLVLQREAALKWTGDAGETVAGLCAKVRFTFEVKLALRRQDFRPFPRVSSVVLAIQLQPEPLLSAAEGVPFRAFVERGFSRGKGDLRRNLGEGMSGAGYRAAAAALAFAPDAHPSELTVEQWIGLWRRRRS